MPVKMEPSWQDKLSKEFELSYFKKLMEFVGTEYAQHKCYPPQEQVFAAFDRTPFQDVKVVILGQDPYHGAGQANGLCFSVSDGITTPPSLQNIYKEICQDLGTPISNSGNLERWSDQGVLLLNAILTVRANEAGSHQKKGWEQFTSAVITALSAERRGIVFMLWGGYAKKKGGSIDKNKHLVLESGHPSPLSANRGYWFGNRHFSNANSYLLQQKNSAIKW